jgi:hypothetical protein
VDSTTTVSATNTESTPWLTATFTDVTGGVQMVLSGAGLNEHDNGVGGGTGSGFQHAGATTGGTAANSLGWFFNAENVDVTTLTFTKTDKHVDAHQTSFTDPTITTHEDFFNTTGSKGTGSGLYDINVQFVEGDTTSEFQFGDSITYLITGGGSGGANTVTAADFGATSSSSDGSTTQYCSAAFLENGSSGWISSGSSDCSAVPTPTPEPSTLVMTGSALALIRLLPAALAAVGLRRGWRRSADGIRVSNPHFLVAAGGLKPYEVP